MRYGRSIEDGFLLVFSVDTEEQARALLVAACGTNPDGEFVARELAYEQSVDALFAFSDRLAIVWDRIKGRWKA